MKKNRIDICKYCGNEMRVEFEPFKRYTSYRTNYDYPSIFYRCPVCESKTPSIILNSKHINREIVNADIEEMIATIKEEEE